MKITFQQLRLFVAVAEEEHISRAGEKMFISQSAVSMALAELEQQLQHPLFDRIGKRLLLNSHGRLLLPEAKSILLHVNALPQLLSNKGTDLKDHLTIGASNTLGSYLLPKFLSQFAGRYPQVKIELKITNSRQVIDDLIALKLDMGFIEGECRHPDLAATVWQKDEMVVIASPKHPLACKKKLTWQDFAKANWVLREPGSGTQEVFNNAVKNHFTPLILLQLGSNEAVKHALISGTGLGCLSKLAIETELKNRKLVALTLPKRMILRPLLMLSHRSRYESPALLALKQTLTAAL